MEQSHSPSDVLSGLRENPSALMSARLAVKWSPPSHAPAPAFGGRWCWRGVDSSWQPGGWEWSSGQRGGRSGFFQGHLKGRRGAEVRRRRCWLDTRTLQRERRGSRVAPLNPVASPQVAMVVVRGATVTHSDSAARMLDMASAPS